MRKTATGKCFPYADNNKSGRFHQALEVCSLADIDRASWVCEQFPFHWLYRYYNFLDFALLTDKSIQKFICLDSCVPQNLHEMSLMQHFEAICFSWIMYLSVVIKPNEAREIENSTKKPPDLNCQRPSPVKLSNSNWHLLVTCWIESVGSSYKDYE